MVSYQQPETFIVCENKEQFFILQCSQLYFSSASSYVGFPVCSRHLCLLRQGMIAENRTSGRKRFQSRRRNFTAHASKETFLAGGNDEKQRYFQAKIGKAERRGGELRRVRNTPLRVSLFWPQLFKRWIALSTG